MDKAEQLKIKTGLSMAERGRFFSCKFSPIFGSEAERKGVLCWVSAMVSKVCHLPDDHRLIR